MANDNRLKPVLLVRRVLLLFAVCRGPLRQKRRISNYLNDNTGIKDDITLTTDSNGKFSLELPPGFYDVFVTATAFTPRSDKIRLKGKEGRLHAQHPLFLFPACRPRAHSRSGLPPPRKREEKFVQETVDRRAELAAGVVCSHVDANDAREIEGFRSKPCRSSRVHG